MNQELYTTVISAPVHPKDPKGKCCTAIYAQLVQEFKDEH